MTTTPERQPLSLSSYKDILAYVPHALGFHPRNSAVLLLIDDDRLEATLRVDLPPSTRREDVENWSSQVNRLLERIPSVQDVALVIYAPEDRLAQLDAPYSSLVNHLETTLSRRRIRLRHAWCLRASMIWDYDPEEGNCAKAVPSLVTNETHLSMVLAGSAPMDTPWDGTGVAKWSNSKDVLHLVVDQGGNVMECLEAWNRTLKMTQKDSESSLRDDPRLAALLLGSLQTKFVRDLLPYLAGQGLEDTLDMIFGVSFDAQEGAIAPLSDYLLGRGWYAPDWRRVDRLWEVARDLLGVACDDSRHALLCILAWIEWARGRGSMALALLNQAVEENEKYELAALLQKLMSHGIMPSWATDQLRAWRANFA